MAQFPESIERDLLKWDWCRYLGQPPAAFEETDWREAIRMVAYYRGQDAARASI